METDVVFWVLKEVETDGCHGDGRIVTCNVVQPLSSEQGTSKTVEVRFWHWL